jgi:alpha-ketoglutarate-dependent taurine dioxygenase
MKNHVDLAPPDELDISREPGKPPILWLSGVPSIGAARDWIAEHRTALRAELLRSGCLLLRGLPIRGAADFAGIRDNLVDQRASYKEKATPRSDYGADVFSSTDLPAAQQIMLHNENSYVLEFPGVLIFCCLTAPEQGGATTVGDMRQALRHIPQDLLGRFRALGWTLSRSYGEYLSMTWSRAFGVTERSEVERYCRTQLVGYEWREEDLLHTDQRRPAIITHPVTGEEVWFNHCAFWNKWSLDAEVLEVLTDTYGAGALPFDTSFGDGMPITRDEIAALNDAYAKVTVRDSWQPGDVLVVDNILVAHGREAFRGDREILVAMGEPVRIADCSPTVPPAPGPRPQQEEPC